MMEFCSCTATIWARGWLFSSDDGSIQLSPFQDSGYGPFTVVMEGRPSPGTRYDIVGQLRDTEILVDRLFPSDNQSEPEPTQIEGLRSWSRSDYLAMLEEVESQPWFSDLVLGGVGDADELGRPLSDCLHVKYLTSDAVAWLESQPPGGFQLWPMVSDNRDQLAP